MSDPAHNTIETQDERARRAAEIVDDVRQRRGAGEILDDEQVLTLHPELRSEVSQKLRQLALIEGARRRAEVETRSAAVGEAPATTRERLPAIPGYRMLRTISGGGQTVVYEAIQQSTGRKVAVKVLHGRALAGAGERARFEREVKILGALDHPNIVSIVDRGETPDGMLFLAMDFIDGKCLDKYLFAPPQAASEQCEPGQLLRLFMKIADAVNTAHLRGVIHRDLKPSNILIDERGEPHVLDFGLARTGLDRYAADSSSPVSITGQFLGSLPWASPEQADGKPDKLDVRTDVYSLGVILYQMLTGGQFPYEVVGNMRDVLNNILTAEPTPPSRLLAVRDAKAAQRKRRWRKSEPIVNPVIEGIVLKALAKKRENRYQTAGELARDVASYLSGAPPRAIAAVTGGKKTAASHRKAAVIAALTVTVAIAALTFIRLPGFLHPRIVVGTGDRPVNTSDSPVALPPRTVEYTAPLCPSALVAAPIKLPGITSWTIETRGYRGTAFAVAVNPRTGTIAVGSEDGAIRIWDNSTGAVNKKPTILLGHDRRVQLITWSRDGENLATYGADQTVRVWRGPRLRLTQTLPTTGQSILDLALADDGEYLAVRCPTTTLVWDLAKDERRCREEPGCSADWLPRSHALAVLRKNGMTAVHDADGVLRSRAGESDYAVPALLSFSADGGLYACAVSRDGRWELENHDARTGRLLVHSRVDFEPEILRWSAKATDRVLVVGGGRAAIWYLNSGTATGDLSLIDKPGIGHVYSGGWLPKGDYAILASATGVWSFGAVHGEADVLIHQASDSSQQVSWSSDGKFFAVAGSWVSGIVTVTDVTTGNEIASVPGSAGKQDRIRWSPTGSHFLSLNDAEADIIDASHGRCLAVAPLAGARISGADWSHDRHRIAYCDRAGRTSVWEIGSDPKSQSQLNGLAGSTPIIAWSPDDRLLLTASTTELEPIRIWDAVTGQQEREITPGCIISSLTWLPDSRRFLSGGADGTIRMWDSRTGEILATDRVAHGRITSLVGDTTSDAVIVTTERDGILSCVLPEFTASREFIDSGSPAISAAVSPSGDVIASGGLTTRFYDRRSARILGSLVLFLDGHTLPVAAHGAFRGFEGINDQILFVQAKSDSEQETLTPAEFSTSHPEWRNDPSKATNIFRNSMNPTASIRSALDKTRIN